MLGERTSQTAMIDADKFIDLFTDYLVNPDRLPFISPSYEVRVDSPAALTKRSIENGYPVEFQFYRDGEVFGHLEVSPRKFVCSGDKIISDEPDTFMIIGINSGRKGTKPFLSKPGYGREFVRRTVLFALENGYRTVKTSIFTHSASSFWLNMGWRSDRPVQPKWHNAGDLSYETDRWKDELDKSSDALWKMARTEFGKRVLFNTGRCGVLDFQDEVQRSYALQRLQLTAISPNSRSLSVPVARKSPASLPLQAPLLLTYRK